MAARALILLAVCLCAFPAAARAIEGEPGSSRVPVSEALYALNSLQISGAPSGALRELFDAGLRRQMTSPEISVSLPTAPRVEPRPAPQRAASLPPFALRIPDVPPPAYEREFSRLLSRGDETRGYDETIQEQARRYGLDPRLIKSIIAAESEFTRWARSPRGAIGLMQLMPATAGEFGTSAATLFDPKANIRAGTAYLLHLFASAWRRYHLKGVGFDKAPQWLLQRILAAYNAGPRFLGRHHLCRQTRLYVYKVLLLYRSAVTELRPDSLFKRVSSALAR